MGSHLKHLIIELSWILNNDSIIFAMLKFFNSNAKYDTEKLLLDICNFVVA